MVSRNKNPWYIFRYATVLNGVNENVFLETLVIMILITTGCCVLTLQLPLLLLPLKSTLLSTVNPCLTQRLNIQET